MSTRSRPLPLIRAMLFDTFGTVVDWRGGIIRETSAFFSRNGIDRDAVQFADDWRQRYQPAMESIRSGRRSFVRHYVLHLAKPSDRKRHAGAMIAKERGKHD